MTRCVPTGPGGTRLNRRPRHYSILAAALCIAACGCQPVSFYEKERLNGRLMAFDSESGDANFQQKTWYSREASIGGIGATAGGGCGCTN